MEFTEEQLTTLEFQKQQQEIQLTSDTRRRREELVRIAKEIIVENNRSKELNERQITASDITEIATKLEIFIKSS